MSVMSAMPRSVGFVRTWVRLYTVGLPTGLRDARRDEIDTDLWEQARDAASELTPSLTSHVLFRWLIGLPDDLLWRIAHIRSEDASAKEGAMVQGSDFKKPTVVAALIAAVMLAWLVFNTVLGEISFQRQADVAFYVHSTIMVSVYGPVGIAAIAGGFYFMRKAPILCALLVTAGSLALAILVFWLVIPELLAIGLSYYAFRRARQIQAGG